MDIFADIKTTAILSTIIYSVIGIVLFILSFVIIQKICPFSLRKELEEDQNTAIAIIIGAVFISLAIIIHAAIRG